MTVETATAKHTHVWNEKTWYFCSGHCKTKFAAEPERYADRVEKPDKPAPAPAPAAGTIYTCPMHPEVRQVGPGVCPKCGMALEPVVATGAEGPNPELVDMTRRFRIGLALTIPVLALAMAEHVAALHQMLPDMKISAWIQFVFSIPVVLWAAVLVRGWNSLISRSLNMYTLIALGVGGGFASVVATLCPACFRRRSGRTTAPSRSISRPPR
jgi:Cu+-exporting ATPase